MKEETRKSREKLMLYKEGGGMTPRENICTPGKRIFEIGLFRISGTNLDQGQLVSITSR